MYGIVGNGETCAFISIFSSLDWLCLPRFDSPTMFARALDSVNGGSITLSREQAGTSTPFERGEQRYLEDTNLLETTSRVGADTVPGHRLHALRQTQALAHPGRLGA